MGSETERGVFLKKGESVDRALKRLKTKLDSEGIIEEMRRRRAFESPAERKRRKARTAVKRHRVRWRYISEATEKKIEERKAERAERAERKAAGEGTSPA
ncbi:MAG: 30S ribosomal protein S21 [Akkermansiaceae bacterium]|nr:30S ribosomal protein S21 [Akkermansiaceae bacterium]